MEASLIRLHLPCSDSEKIRLAGEGEKNFVRMENLFQVKVLSREPGITIQALSPENAHHARESLERLFEAMRNGHELTDFLVNEIIDKNSSQTKSAEIPFEKPILIDRYGNPIQAKTKGQSRLIQEIKSHDITFAAGPAGTGKTFIAVALAVAALEKKLVNKLILCRPAVESGESLGFLPGEISDKIAPYMRPLHDSLSVLLAPEKLKAYRDMNAVEIAPLAYMRGRTLSKCFVILDEGQNTTTLQMKMFLTRIGLNTKVVITGDESQVDLPRNENSGFAHARKILSDIEGIGQVKLDVSDVVRHRLVMDIIEAYERHAKR